MADQKWFQQVLLQEEVVEIRVRIGLIPSRDHGQWQLEVVDPTTERLIDMQSNPHFDTRRWTEALAVLESEIVTAVGMVIQPF